MKDVKGVKDVKALNDVKRLKNITQLRNAWLLITFTSFTIFTAFSPSSSAQQKPPVFRTGINLRQLDVTVHDRHRQPVRDLTIEDFRIEEDGKPRPIQAFSFVDVPDSRVDEPAWARTASNDVVTNDLDGTRVFALVVDDVRGMGDLWANREMKASVATFVGQLGNDDVAAVIFPGMSRWSQTFTRDKARLTRTVDWYGTRLETSVGAKGMCEPGRRLPSTLIYLADTMATMKNKRKAIVYFGGRLFFTTGIDQCGVGLLWKQFLATANENNITVYPVDTMGLRVRPRLIGNPYLSLAARTGGVAVLNSNSFDEGLARVMSHSASYYLLAYEAGHPEDDGRFHRVVVKVNRPGVEVLSTRSYWAPKPPTAKRPAPPPLAPEVEALAGVLPMAQIPMRAVGAPFRVDGAAGAVVAVAIGLEPPAFDQRTRETVDLLVRKFTPDGIDYGTDQQMISLTVPAAPAGAETSRYDLIARVEVPTPGRYELRFSAHSLSTDARGSIYLDVNVPEFAKEKLSLSGVVVQALSAPPAAPMRVVQDVTPLVPTTARSFRAADVVLAFVRLYQGGSDRVRAVTLKTRILDAAGKEVFEKSETMGAARFGDARAADYQLRLPLASLPGAGAYLLTLEATLGKLTVTRDVVFQVR